MSRMNDQFKNILPQTELQETSDIIAQRSLAAFQPKTSFDKLLEAFSPNTQNNFLNMKSEVSVITPSPQLPGLDDTVVLEPRTTPLGIGAAFDAAFDNNLSSTLISSLVSRGYGLAGEPVSVDEFFRAKEKELKSTPEGRYVWYNNYLRGEYNQMDTDLRLLTAINNDMARFNNNKVLSDKSWYNPAVIVGGLADPIAAVPGIAGAKVAIQLGATATKGALGVGAGLLRTEAGMLAYGLTRETVLQSVDPDRTTVESTEAIAADLVIGAALYGIPVVAYRGVKRIWGPKDTPPPAAGQTVTPEAPTPGPTTPESPVATAINDSVPPASTVEVLTQPDHVTPAQKSQYSQKVDSYQQTIEEVSPEYADRMVVSDFYEPESYSRSIAKRAVRFEETIKAQEPGLPQVAVEDRALEMAMNSMEVDPPTPVTERIVAEERVYPGTNQADFIDRESSSGGLTGDVPVQPPAAESGGGGQKPPGTPTKVAGGAEEPSQPRKESVQGEIVRQSDYPNIFEIEAALRGEPSSLGVERPATPEVSTFQGALPENQNIYSSFFREFHESGKPGFWRKLFRGSTLRNAVEEYFEEGIEGAVLKNGDRPWIKRLADRMFKSDIDRAAPGRKETATKMAQEKVAKGLSKISVNVVSGLIGAAGIPIGAIAFYRWLTSDPREKYSKLNVPEDTLAQLQVFDYLISSPDFQADLSSALENIVQTNATSGLTQDMRTLLKDKATIDRAEWNIRALNALQKFQIQKAIQDENLDSSLEAIELQFEAAFEPLEEEISIFGERYQTFIDLSKENEELLKDLPNILQLSARLAMNDQRTKGFGNTIAAFDSNVRNLFPQASNIWEKLASPLLSNLQSIDNRSIVDLHGEGSDYLAGLVVVTIADSIAANIRGSNMLDFSAANDIISTKMYGKIEETKSNDQEKLVYGTNYAPNTGRAIVNHIGLNSELNAGINANNVNALWSSLMLDDLYAFRQLHSAFVNKLSYEFSGNILNTTSTEGFLTDRLSPLLPSGYTPR